MKTKEQVMMGDGFDRNVAEKMPRIKQQEEPSFVEEEPEPKSQMLAPQPQGIPEKEADQRTTARSFPPFEGKEKVESDPNLDVTGLIEDLHHQLLVSSRAMRALEVELASSRRTLHQLGQDNVELRQQIEELNRDLQGLRETEAESRYLKEENEEASERIRELQRELRTMKETLTRTTQEREGVLRQVEVLESQKEQNEVLWIKGRLKEKEASHFSEENRELRASLEKALDQNMEVERKYEALKKSFREVKESLGLLRDSCKSNYYNLNETAGDG
jgi:chromosome segregation ATPase